MCVCEKERERVRERESPHVLVYRFFDKVQKLYYDKLYSLPRNVSDYMFTSKPANGGAVIDVSTIN